RGPGCRRPTARSAATAPGYCGSSAAMSPTRHGTTRVAPRRPRPARPCCRCRKASAPRGRCGRPPRRRRRDRRLVNARDLRTARRVRSFLEGQPGGRRRGTLAQTLAQVSPRACMAGICASLAALDRIREGASQWKLSTSGSAKRRAMTAPGAGKATNKLRIAVIPGDGIGNEVVPEGIRVLEAAGARFGLDYAWDHYDWSCQRFAKTGAMMPADGLAQIAKHDAIYLGAVGWPGVPDHVSLWGLLIPIRRGFQQYVNLRPVRLFEGLKSPLADRKPGDIDYFIVRENNEGEYSSVGGRSFEGTELEQAIQVATFTRKGCDRVMRYAFDLAMTRKRREVVSATKSNGISISMPYWDERFAAIAKEYPQVKTSQFHIDILCAHLVRDPTWFDVIVGSNLFGDILSDLGP